MGKARSIQIDTRFFEKAGDATAFFSSMLQGYPQGARVSDADAEDLYALIKRHDEMPEKVGCGIDYFAVDAAPDYPDQRCFWIVRTDGSRIDVSYKHCLERKHYD